MEETVSFGDTRLNNLKNALSKIDARFQRNTYQIQMHNFYIANHLQRIYVNKTIPIKLVDNYSNNQRPRRLGKTTGDAIFVAAYAWSQSGSRVLVQCSCRRAMKHILSLINRFIILLADGDSSVIVKYDQENLVILSRNENSYIRTLRGDNEEIHIF